MEDLQTLLAGRLALRMRDRGLTITTVAAHLEVSVTTVWRWKHGFPLTLSDEGRVRLERLLQVPDGWILDPSSPLPASTPAINAPTFASVAAEIRAIGTELVARAWRRLDAQRIADRSNLIAHRYGVDGEENAKVRVIGERLRISREGVRKILTETLKRNDRSAIEAPRLAEPTGRMAAHPGASVAELDSMFAPLLGEQLSVVGAERFRIMLGLNLQPSAS
ncbi:MAG: helix-turn-helix domain-containing protein [Betaproteobacteria bacterium]|nr:helix-turn-helix domain-containing protein [Betaproteobacteria bacterium]